MVACGLPGWEPPCDASAVHMLGSVAKLRLGAIGYATMRVVDWSPRAGVSVAILFQVEGADCPCGPRGSLRGSANPAPRRRPAAAPAQVGPRGGPRSYYCNREVIIATTKLLLQPRSYYCSHEVIIATTKLLLQPRSHKVIIIACVHRKPKDFAQDNLQ